MSIEPGAFYLGHADDKTERVYKGELHAVLLGPNGVGKGMRVLVPNLLMMSGKSIVVIDPKGQLAAMTAKHRAENKNDVKIIDPFGVMEDVFKIDPVTYEPLRRFMPSAGFNPLAALDPDSRSFYDDAAIIAEALIKVSDKDPHWGESAQGLLAALMMWECKSCKEARERKEAGDGDWSRTTPSLVHVRDMLTAADDYGERPKVGPDGKPVEKADGTPETDSYLSSGLRATATAMVKFGGFEIASLAGRFAGSRNDEIDSIISSADTQTRWLLSRPMRADLEAESSVDFRQLKTGLKPLTVYVVLPANYLETHSVWLRLVVSEALRASMTVGGRGVVLMLDEFAALGHLPIIERFFGVTRDYRVQMWPILQDLPQLKGLYPQRWETLLGMAGVVQSFRAGDLTTAEWLSKRSGTRFYTTKSRNDSSGVGGGGVSSGQSSGENEIIGQIIKYEETFGFRDYESIAFFSGKQAYETLSMPHLTNIHPLDGHWLSNPYYRK